ncbi:AraC family transcriptional regulator [Mangrovimonas sp. YM274]|uniref:helix-turn-helix domain-containing protein n=1 Tax=Mangrovimonas sp. YM274 TaxID=3070660 RepID=UPI0027DB49C5|nr:helix-turn-helix domain-containing protein [Mangrovimonas sp. YM274]WMI69497.1 helix-turn-helix domain-containing protein [Mangrovimonas sp. YM274]
MHSYRTILPFKVLVHYYHLAIWICLLSAVGVNASTLMESNVGVPSVHTAHDSVLGFKEKSMVYANLNQPLPAVKFLEKYIRNSADFTAMNFKEYDKIRNSKEFEVLSESFEPKMTVLSFIYLYIALIGFFIAIVLNFSKKNDRWAKILISGFLGVHSLFILEFVLYNTNYQYKYIHTYLMSSSVALLYGPLLYFYFKRITQNYQFKAIDLLHLLPVIALMFILVPIYSLPALEKLKIIMGTSTLYAKTDFLYLIFIPKLLSLVIYGALIRRLYFSSKQKETIANQELANQWKDNLYKIHVVYVLSYFIYGISISGVIGQGLNIIYQSQVISMSLMVLYIASMVYIQPKVFASSGIKLKPSLKKDKYKKSGLTTSFSNELKDTLMKLLLDEKIYRDSSLNLEKLSEKLDTSRHNTSQIINEHFNENFFELVNDFRIQEAKELLEISNPKSKMNISEIFYEVGFNNKVTFNNAFKKRTGITPSQYRKENS